MNAKLADFTPMEHPLAVLIPSNLPASELVRTARTIEELGFGDAWVAEDYFALGGFSSAATVLGVTQRLHCGIGIVAAVARHPAVTAMEYATLAGAFPGRARLGIGHGVPFWTHQMGLGVRSPLRVLREAIGHVRALLDGGTVTHESGHFVLRDVTLSSPFPAGGLYAGVIGPKSLRLAGEIADGTLASVLSTPDYVTYAREHIGAGMLAADRSTHSFPVLALIDVQDDEAQARAAVRPVVAHYLFAAGPTALTEPLGINDEIARLREDQDPERFTREMPEQWPAALAMAGTPETCVRQIRDLLDAGASQVALAVARSEAMDEQLARIGRDVLPYFK